MGDPPALKRPKLENDDHDSAYCPRPSANGTAPEPPSASAAASRALPNDDGKEAMAEEAVDTLVMHRERDEERCKLKLLHYQSLVRAPAPASSPSPPFCDDADD